MALKFSKVRVFTSLSDSTVKPENAYSFILKVLGQVWESQKWILANPIEKDGMLARLVDVMIDLC